MSDHEKTCPYTKQEVKTGLRKTRVCREVSAGVGGVGTDARQSLHHKYILSPPWVY